MPCCTDKKKPHIKKPLNAFMLYMKEMRAKVVAECTLKESAAINQILGRRVSLNFYLPMVFDVAYIYLFSQLIKWNVAERGDKSFHFSLGLFLYTSKGAYIAALHFVSCGTTSMILILDQIILLVPLSIYFY
jgi:hypothetical protein